MTIERRNSGKGHAYLVDGQRLPGVTTILDQVPKAALIKWAAETTANYAVDNWAVLSGLRPSARLDRLKSARFEDRDTAGNRGTAVHKLAERLHMGQTVAVPEELAGHVESYTGFLDTLGVVVIAAELVVANRAVRYCGTTDLIGELPELEDQDGNVIPAARWLLDLKTGRSGIWPESALQTCAYSRAEVFAGPDGEECDLASLGIERCGAVHVRADGWSLVPLDTGPGTWEHFQHLAWLHHDQEAMSSWVGTAVSPPVPAMRG
jgi:hypothetical protein